MCLTAWGSAKSGLTVIVWLYYMTNTLPLMRRTPLTEPAVRSLVKIFSSGI